MRQKRTSPRAPAVEPAAGTDSLIGSLLREALQDKSRLTWQLEQMTELASRAIEQLQREKAGVEYKRRSLELILEGKELLESIARDRQTNAAKRRRRAVLRDWSELEAAIGKPEELGKLLKRHGVPPAKLATFKSSNIAAALAKTHGLTPKRIRDIKKLGS